LRHEEAIAYSLYGGDPHINRSHKRTKDVLLDEFLRGQMRLAAGLRPDQLGELERSPRTLATIEGRGPICKGKAGKGEGREGKGKRGRLGKGTASSLFNFWLRAWLNEHKILTKITGYMSYMSSSLC